MAEIERLNHEVLESDAGQYWQTIKDLTSGREFVLNLTVVNGKVLYTDTGLPLTRLRNYQVELLHHCFNFLDQVEAGEANQSQLTAKVNMGVGSGKTFFTFTLLQQIENRIQNGSQLSPPFCLAPNVAVAEVTSKTISQQGIQVGKTAHSITGQTPMPSKSFLEQYEELASEAQKDAAQVERYLAFELQSEILKFCHQNDLHPTQLINHIGNLFKDDEYIDRMGMFKDSIDSRRLLLIVEAQNIIMEKTGMQGLAAIENLLEQFTAIEEAIKKRVGNIFHDALKDAGTLIKPDINYNQNFQLKNGDVINITQLTQEKFCYLIEQKYRHLKSKRDVLLRLSCLTNKDAAILLANSGGLGKSYTEEQLLAQINEYMPYAFEQFQSLAQTRNWTLQKHYLLFIYLNELLSPIPECIRLKFILDKQAVETMEKQLYIVGLKKNIHLIEHIKGQISSKIKSLRKAKDSPFFKELQPFGIHEGMTVIEAANRLASIAALQITGTAKEHDAKLLLSHIHVFTPEGLANYFEHLAKQEPEEQCHFKKMNGIFTLKKFGGRNNRQAIINRLQQILQAVVIADEIHKPEFACLYDTTNPIYQRLNRVTTSYLDKPFNECLPPRIGMSGTMNAVATRAFGPKTIYTLTTQQMIQQGLMKQVDVRTMNASFATQEEYAKQLVIEYFVNHTMITFDAILKGRFFDLFTTSKGLIFTKQTDETFRDAIVYYFNLLFRNQGLTESEKKTQCDLFKAINDERERKSVLLRTKLSGEGILSPAEMEQLQQYYQIANRSEHSIAQNPIRLNAQAVLDANQLEKIHRTAMQNNLYAIYLEYVLSKSNKPLEMSDIVGLQNRLAQNRLDLLNIADNERNEEITHLQNLLKSVDPKVMSASDIKQFIKTKCQHPQIQQLLIDLINLNKNNYQAAARQLIRETKSLPLPDYITRDRTRFEAGFAQVLLATEEERTGYSHEPIGIVVDAPLIFDSANAIHKVVQSSKGKTPLELRDIQAFYEALQPLVLAVYSYDEKNQAGGRALRTPHGFVQYIEFQSELSQLLALFDAEKFPSLHALKFEISFSEIFTQDEKKAAMARASVEFNRQAFLALDTAGPDDFAIYVNKMQHQFKQELQNPDSIYQSWMTYRLPFIWALKNQPQLVLDYLSSKSEEVFSGMQVQFHSALAEVEPVPDENSADLKEKFHQNFQTLNDITANYPSPLTEAVLKTVNTLHTALVTASEQYFDKKAVIAHEFKRLCFESIHEAQDNLYKTQGLWDALSPILSDILRMLTVVDDVQASVVMASSSHGYGDTFFQQPKEGGLTQFPTSDRADKPATPGL